MKVILLFEDNEIVIETPNEISVKALKKQLSSHLSILSDKMSIMNENEVLDENHLISKEDGSKKFIIYKPIEVRNPSLLDQEKEFMLEDNDMDDLIMKVTGAKKKIVGKKPKITKNKSSSIESKLETMNQLFSRYPVQRSSLLLRQQFENIFTQTNNIRETLNLEENINNLSSNSNSNDINNIYSPFNFYNHNNPILNTIIRNHPSENSLFIQSNNNQPNDSILNFNHYLPNLIPFRRSSVQPDFQCIKNLVEMGFSEDQAKRALSLTGNNLNAAADLLLSNQNLDDIGISPTYSNQRVPSTVHF